MESNEPDAEPQAPALPPFWKRFVDTFFSPGAMSEAVAARPAWVVPLVVGGALLALQTFLIPPEIWEASFRQQMLESGRQMPDGFSMSGNLMRISGLVGGVVFWFLYSFLMAGVVTLIFAFILGDEGRFVQYLAIMAHAWLVPATLGLFMVPLRIAQENPQLNLSLVNFFYFLDDGYLRGVLTFMDLSQLWAWAIVAWGASIIDRRRGFGGALAIVMGMMLVLALIFGRFIPT